MRRKHQLWFMVTCRNKISCKAAAHSSLMFRFRHLRNRKVPDQVNHFQSFLFFTIFPFLPDFQSSFKTAMLESEDQILVCVQILIGEINYLVPAPLTSWEQEWNANAKLELTFCFHWANPFSSYRQSFQQKAQPPLHALSLQVPAQIWSILLKKASSTPTPPSSQARLPFIERAQDRWCERAPSAATWEWELEEQQLVLTSWGNGKLPHSGSSMMDAHCRVTTAWPPSSSDMAKIKGGCREMCWMETKRTILLTYRRR